MVLNLVWNKSQTRVQKNALALAALVEAEQAEQEPVVEEAAKAPPPAQDAPATVDPTNPHGVKAEQVWEALDPRQPGRRVVVLEVVGPYAWIRGTATGLRRRVALKRFRSTRTGFKLVGTVGSLNGV